MDKTVKLDLLLKDPDFMGILYDAARLVNPVTREVYESRGELCSGPGKACHELWKQHQVCEHCVSMRAYLENKNCMKLEQLDDAVFLVTAIPVQAAEPTVLELLKDATDSMVYDDDTSKGHLFGRIKPVLGDLAPKKRT